MNTKPSIAIVGAGNLANALAMALHHTGYRIEEIIAHSGGISLRKAQTLAGKIGSRVSIVSAANLREKIVWFCVPDGEIQHASGALVDKTDWSGKIAVHSSGALASDELSSLRKRGAMVASVHPLMTFVPRSFSIRSEASARKSKSIFAEVPFAVEGDAAAVRLARRIVKDLGGRAYAIRKNDKAAYHAWGTFASPLFTTLLATTEHVAALAGVHKKDVRSRIIPILRQTLANYELFGAAGGFSGPIIRGDVDTVNRHLRVLRKAPAALDVYVALANSALRYLPAKNEGALMRVLHSGRAKRKE